MGHTSNSKPAAHTMSAMTQEVSGLIVDRSDNNAPVTNWQEVKDSGVIAIIAKASEGPTWKDPTYQANLKGALSVELPLIGYHFAHFTNAAIEAALFLSVAGARARMLDSETNKDAAWQNAFLVALNEPADEEIDYGSASTLPRGGIRSLLFPASYGKAPGFGDCWQFTDAQTVPGMPGKVDASEWIGTQADFDALFSITPPPQPEEGDDSMFGDLAASKQDNFNATLRHLWNTYRTDPMTVADVQAYWYAYNLPLAQGGFGGQIDPLLAHLVDTASAGKTLRPALAPSV